jgi:sec-independent protein translocase protein TatA
MPHIGMQELLIILAVVLLIFGGKKLPELAKGLGEGLREFKKAAKSPENEEAPAAGTQPTDKPAST